MKSRVKDVMTRTVVVVNESAPFKEIVALMKEHRVSAIPVVDRDAKLIGIVSEADLLLKEAFEPDEEVRLFERRRRRIDRSKAAGLRASQIMTSPAVTLTHDATLIQAARLMRDRRIKRIPVVDEDGARDGQIQEMSPSGFRDRRPRPD
jgi:CBS domain-containing protein